MYNLQLIRHFYQPIVQKRIRLQIKLKSLLQNRTKIPFLSTIIQKMDQKTNISFTNTRLLIIVHSTTNFYWRQLC